MRIKTMNYGSRIISFDKKYCESEDASILNHSIITASESKCSFHGPPPSDVGPDSSRGRCQPVWTPKIRGPPFSDWEIWGPGTPRVSHGTKFFGPKFFSYYFLKMCICHIFPFFSQNSKFHAKNIPILT